MVRWRIGVGGSSRSIGINGGRRRDHGRSPHGTRRLGGLGRLVPKGGLCPGRRAPAAGLLRSRLRCGLLAGQLDTAPGELCGGVFGGKKIQILLGGGKLPMRRNYIRVLRILVIERGELPSRREVRLRVLERRDTPENGDLLDEVLERLRMHRE